MAGPRVALYTRISLDETIQKYSLSAQRERLEAYCKGQYGDEWTLHRVYRDSATGTNLNRPELQRMISDAKAGAFDLLLVFRVDRLSRRVAELSLLASELKSYGVDLKSATEPIDTSTPAGMMIFQTLGVFAEFEQKSIVERTKAGMLKKAKSGSWPGGRVPLGYRLEESQGLVIEEPEAQIIRRIFELYVQGNEGSSAIAHELNRSGFRTRRGKKFSRKTVLDILRNPFYVGRFRWQKQEFESDHEPIVSDEIFEAAQQILQKRSGESAGKRWKNQSERILTGLMRCSRCNSAMFGVSANVRGNKVTYYACRKRLATKDCDQDYIRADLIEEKILGDIQAVFQDETLLQSVWEAAQAKLIETRPNIDAEITAAQQARQKSQAALQRYYIAFEAGTMEPTTCNERVAELSAQVHQLEAQIADLERQRDELDLPALRMEFIHEILTNLQGVVEAVPAAQKKHLLQLLVEKVLVKDRCTFDVWYRLPQLPEGVRTLSHLVPSRLQYANRKPVLASSAATHTVFCLGEANQRLSLFTRFVRPQPEVNPILRDN